MSKAVIIAALAVLATAAAAPFNTGTGLLPLGASGGCCLPHQQTLSIPKSSTPVDKPVDKSNAIAGSLLTTDSGGPYNLTLLPVQSNEIKSGWLSQDTTFVLFSFP